LIANLVEERPGFEFGDYNFKLRRTFLDTEDDQRLSEFVDLPDYIGSLQDNDF
jgi:hypothetical protein